MIHCRTENIVFEISSVFSLNDTVNVIGTDISSPPSPVFVKATIIILLGVRASDWRPRILKGVGLLSWCSAFITVLALLDSRTWPAWNALATIVVVLMLGGAGGCLASFVWASSGDFLGMEVYINLGNSIAGIIVALLSIVAKVKGCLAIT